jgi:hypothetical protein
MNDLKFTTAGEYMDKKLIISKYWSDQDAREAIVERDEVRYYAHVKSAFGTWYVSVFLSLDDAEDFAENWVYETAKKEKHGFQYSTE